MQTQMQIEQMADRLTSSLFDSSIHNCSRDSKADIKERASDILDDTDRLMEVVLESSFVDFYQFSNTFRAMVNAHISGNDLSMMAFAKSLCLDIQVGVEERAAWELSN